MAAGSSAAYEKIGEVLEAQGSLAEALRNYRTSFAIAERLAAADPTNAGWQYDLSVSHNRIARVLVEQGALEEALGSYRASLAIRERLAAIDPNHTHWQRGLAISHGNIGDVLMAQGALADALGSSARASPSASASRPATRAMPTGNTTCRSRTTRSVMCWWSRARWPTRSTATARAS